MKSSSHHWAIVSTLFVLGICLPLVSPAQSPTAETLTVDEFRRLHAELQPDNDEPWRTIPWKTSVLDAQRDAAESNKPIFIWAMDGHPLGCT